MQPETFMLWSFVGFIVCAAVIAGLIDIYEHWNKCRHKWTAWSTPEKPEVNHWVPQGYSYQTRCCKMCNQFEKRDIK
jgi:hypothetical protein